MSQAPSVLIVEPRLDEREVLSTVLARRGWRIWEAAAADEGVALAQEHHPDVIVLDADCDAAAACEIATCCGQRNSADEPSIVILGRINCQSLPQASHVIAKPYHFGPLIHKIEQLAAKTPVARAA